MKSKFNILFQEIMKSLITQSGLAITGISRVKKQNIIPTLNNVQKNIFDPLNITKDMWTIVGSVGKKPESGDLDICIDIPKVLEVTNSKTTDEYADKICKQAQKLGWITNNKINGIYKTIHLGVPIIGQRGQICQLDIMNSNDLNYAKFRYYSPSPKESKYKGAHRRILLSSIWYILSLQPIEGQEEPVLDKDQKIIHPHTGFKVQEFKPEGLAERSYSYKGKKSKWLKNPVKLNSTIINNNIQDIINNMLGKDVFTQKDFQSFESIWNNVLMSPKFPAKDKIPQIVDKFIELINEDNEPMIKHGQDPLPIPEEIKQYKQK